MYIAKIGDGVLKKHSTITVNTLRQINTTLRKY